MTTLRRHALDSWALEQEERKQADRKKKKRRAKKIEEAIEDMLPKDLGDSEIHRDLDNDQYGVVVNVVEADGTLQFVQEDGDIAVVGRCPSCGEECISVPVGTAGELGSVLETFRPGSSHACSSEENG
jgi:hypothetical protein